MSGAEVHRSDVRSSSHMPTRGSGLGDFDPRAVAAELFAWSEKLVGVDGAVIHLATPQGLEAASIKEGKPLTLDDRVIRINHPGPIARAQRFATTQIFSEETEPSAPIMSSFGWKSAVCVPLVVDEKVIGVFSAGWRAPFPVSTESRLVLEAAGSLGALVLDRMGLLFNLKSERRRLRQVLEGMPVAASIVEVDSLRVRWRNSEARRLLGDVTPDDDQHPVAGTRLGLVETSRIVTAEDLRALLGGDIDAGRVSLRTADGQERVLAPTVARIDHATSVVVHLDVTHEAHMDRERSRFVRMVSHQLRTPLTPLLGFTQLLASADLAPEVREEATAAVTASVTHLTHLVSRLEQIASLRPVEPHAMGRYSVDHLLRRAWDHLDDVGDEMLVVTGPATRAVQCAERHVVDALAELFANAVSHGAPPVNVKVTVGSDVHLQISDSGTGISSEWEKAVFAPFLSAGEGYLAPAEDHVGLGLSLARGLVLATEGELTYSDRAFWVRLKAAPLDSRP